ncbi:hypothetical protein [Inquilinus sp. Marseille-Q2685]|uniref:hypothetical protein n=1 Tax=Inquilinus sp. Marseille-Q2685 TaxID=2866581 RepID=UPI001CE4A714|nr:hypothetical protein [Inquilinus sp. Marseille-Q2685]
MLRLITDETDGRPDCSIKNALLSGAICNEIPLRLPYIGMTIPIGLIVLTIDKRESTASGSQKAAA